MNIFGCKLDLPQNLNTSQYDAILGIPVKLNLVAGLLTLILIAVVIVFSLNLPTQTPPDVKVVMTALVNPFVYNITFIDGINDRSMDGINDLTASDYLPVPDQYGTNRVYLSNFTVEIGQIVELSINTFGDIHRTTFPEISNPFGVLKDPTGNNINLTVEGPEYSTIRILADQIGVYTYRCVSFCGAGHFGMFGSITVVNSK